MLMVLQSLHEPCGESHVCKPEGEAWGILQALEFVASIGLQHVVFDSDSKCEVDKILKPAVDLSEVGMLLVQNCNRVLSLNPTFDVCFVKREVNGVAYTLARVALSLSSLYTFLLPCVDHLIMNEMP